MLEIESSSYPVLLIIWSDQVLVKLTNSLIILTYHINAFKYAEYIKRLLYAPIMYKAVVFSSCFTNPLTTAETCCQEIKLTFIIFPPTHLWLTFSSNCLF